MLKNEKRRFEELVEKLETLATELNDFVFEANYRVGNFDGVGKAAAVNVTEREEIDVRIDTLKLED